jgi:hypothetical protein
MFIAMALFSLITLKASTLPTGTVKYEVRSSSKVSDFFSQDWEQIDTCGLD